VKERWFQAAILRQRMTLSLSFDHSLEDSAPAARFLQHVEQVRETPFLVMASARPV
jgi:pyruvate/2-oxoglutarate dehydrogenase complex dihydrolipoamide acyltransferase (E2) component